MSKRKLGRGLGSLLGGRQEARTGDEKRIVDVPVERIQPNRWQPRGGVDENSVKGLADSIRREGVLQPVVLRKLGDGEYEIVAGERRWRGAKVAGLRTVPAIVRDVPESQLLELALIENVQREDLNPMERANAYRALMSQLDVTQEEAAKRLGQQRSTLANALRLLELPEELQGLVSRGTLSAGHARAILGLADPKSQVLLAKRVIKEGLSVRATEAVVGATVGRGPAAKGKAKEKAPHIRELEERLRRALGAIVTVRERRKGGHIVIEFSSHQEFDRLLEIFEGGTAGDDG